MSIERYYRNKHKIGKTIYSRTDSHETIYGARALNARFPKYLRKPTQDYDIYTPTPKKDARETERALDRRLGGDYFHIKKATHPRTWRVKSKVDGETYADYTKPNRKIKRTKIKGKYYASVSERKKDAKRNLKNKEFKYRHHKDKDALNRIKIYQKKRKKRRKTSSYSFNMGGFKI